MIYFAEENGGVFSYPAAPATAAAPSPAWARLTLGLNKHAPVALEDMILIGSDQGDFWALDRVTGNVNWSVKTGSAFHMAPWAAGDHVYFVNGRGFHAHSREDGRQMWTYELPGQFLVRRPDAVYLYVGRGTVHALDVNTGKLLRTVNFGEGVRFLTNMTDPNFYAVTQNGFVFMVDVGVE
jgi:outer membrane protein assembly factor BamB